MAEGESEKDDNRTVSGRGEVIRAQRKGKGLSVERLAKLAGLSVRTIERVEADDGRFQINTLLAIADALRLDYDTIYVGPPNSASPTTQIPDFSSVTRLELRLSFKWTTPEDVTKILNLVEEMRIKSGMQDRIAVQYFSSGSINVFAVITIFDAYRLAASYARGDLDQYKVEAISFPLINPRDKATLAHLLREHDDRPLGSLTQFKLLRNSDGKMSWGAPIRS